MIDFKKIRGGNIEGQRSEFEKFVVMLAGYDDCGDDFEFRSLDGSGGDGGVECYWQKADGSEKIGYQAKYFTRSGDISWVQIDKSVETALNTHPELTQYIIALACDLTGKSGNQGKGKTGWGHWETHKEKWMGLAQEKGIDVEFIIWTATELEFKARDKLNPVEIKYWFNEIIFNQVWFDGHIKQATADLGRRYLPNQNIETAIETHFDYFLRESKSEKDMKQAIASLEKEKGAIVFSMSDKVFQFPEWKENFEKLIKTLKDVPDFPYYSENIFEKWDYTDWLEAIHTANNLCQKLLNLITKARHEEKTNGTDRVYRDVLKLSGCLNSILGCAEDKKLQAINKPAFFLEGGAGTGKSHALARLAESEIQAGRPCLLLLGNHFTDASPEQQIVAKLGMGGHTFDEILGALDAAAATRNKIGLVIIDALNEGAGVKLWPRHLGGFIGKIQDYKHLKLILSCRSEYTPYIFDKQQHAFYEHLVEDFSDEEMEPACKKFMDEQGIKRPPYGELLPAFYNPLFLITACEAIRSKNRTEFPKGLKGALQLLQFYIENVAKGILENENLAADIQSDIKMAYRSLAVKMAHDKTTDISVTTASEEIDHIMKIRPPPDGKTWLDVFLQSGALRKDPMHNVEERAFGEPPQETVNFAYQMFGDFLIAEELWKCAQNHQNPFAPDAPLAFIVPEVERHTGFADGDSECFEKYYEISPQWTGVFMALGVVYAEKEKKEILDLLPDNFNADWFIIDAFTSGLFWRTHESISKRTTQLLWELSDKSPDQFMHNILKFATVPGHPWNANFLHKILSRQTMPERDSQWTQFINNESYEDSVIARLINRAVQLPNIMQDGDVAKLSVITLIWTLTTTNRTLRDESTQALGSIFKQHPALIPELLRLFHNVKDLYITERLLAAAYGACCFLNGEDVKNTAKAVYDCFFINDNVPQHLLVRDYAQGVIERAEYLEIVPDGIDIEKCKPPFTSPWPLMHHSNDKIDKIAKKRGDKYSKIARSCVTEDGRGISGYGDFGRYVLESSARNFSICPLNQSAPEKIAREHRLNGETIGNWVAHRAYNYGWTAKLFPHDDGQSLNRHENSIERIGKKYQWIAMYELLGILADHVWMKDWNDVPKQYKSALDLGFCRDVDPTILPPFESQLPEFVDDALLRLPDFDHKAESDESVLLAWPKVDVVTPTHEAVLYEDEDGKRWYRLYAFDRVARSLEKSSNGEKQQTSFVWSNAICINPEKISDFLSILRQNELMDVNRPFNRDANKSDSLFWGEIGWRVPNAENFPWREEVAHDYDDAVNISPYFSPVLDYTWGGDPGREFPKNTNFLCLEASIANKMGLTRDNQDWRVYRDADGEIQFFEAQSNTNYSWVRANACLVGATTFDKFLEENNLACIWTIGGERQTILEMNADRRVWRNFSAVAWIKNGNLVYEQWHGEY